MKDKIRSGDISLNDFDVHYIDHEGARYIFDTRTGTMLDEMAFQRSKWNWKDASSDEKLVGYLKDRLKDNKIKPGEVVTDPIPKSKTRQPGR